METIYIKLVDDNLKLLESIERRIGWNANVLYRTSEYSELRRIIEYGTDRGGYSNDRKWDDGIIPYEDVIYATSAETIRVAEDDETKSSAFKKIPIIQKTDKPIILVYKKIGFIPIADRQWKFKNSDDKISNLVYIIILI
jgi:hypothetical protein